MMLGVRCPDGFRFVDALSSLPLPVFDDGVSLMALFFTMHKTPFRQAVDWATQNDGMRLFVVQREDHVKFGFGASGRAAR